MGESNKSLFFGQVTNILYYLDDGSYIMSDNYYHKPRIEKQLKMVSYKQFFSCDIDKPPLESDEEVYINELDINTKIVKRVRSTSGEYVYYTSHIISEIEDENTSKSLEVANKQLAIAMERYNKFLKKNNKEDIEELPLRIKKKWYQFFK